MHLLQIPDLDPEIPLRRLERRVSEELSDVHDVHAIGDHVGRHRVPECIARDPFLPGVEMIHPVHHGAVD